MQSIFSSLLVGIICVLISIPARAQNGVCDLRDKTISFMIEFCYVGGPLNGQCRYGPQKIKVLQRTLLFYWDVTKNVGVEYSLGETRDLLAGADGIQRQMLLGNNPNALNTFITVQGTAGYEAGNLTVIQQRYRHTSIDRVVTNENLTFKAGQAMFLDEQLISFAINPSCSSCAVRDYHSFARVIGGTILSHTEMNHSSCTVD